MSSSSIRTPLFLQIMLLQNQFIIYGPQLHERSKIPQIVKSFVEKILQNYNPGFPEPIARLQFIRKPAKCDIKKFYGNTFSWPFKKLIMVSCLLCVCPVPTWTMRIFAKRYMFNRYIFHMSVHGPTGHLLSGWYYMDAYCGATIVRWVIEERMDGYQCQPIYLTMQLNLTVL